MTRAFAPSPSGLRSLVLVLLVGVVAGTPPVGWAQSSPKKQSRVAGPSPTWKQNIDKQITRLLSSPDVDRRAEAMRLVIELRRTHGKMIDLSPCAPVLLRRAHAERNENLQLLALTALYEVQSRPTFRKLARQVDDLSSKRVRHHALHILALSQKAKPKS
jgi:hypothetical protein